MFLDLNVALGPRLATSPDPKNLLSLLFPLCDIFVFVNRDRLTITEIPRYIFIRGHKLPRATGKKPFVHRALIAKMHKKIIGFRNFCTSSLIEPNHLIPKDGGDFVSLLRVSGEKRRKTRWM